MSEPYSNNVFLHESVGEIGSFTYITANNLLSSLPLKTNSSKIIVSTLLEISDIDGLTATLNTLVVGPSFATDNAICRYDLASGKIIQNSTATISDSGILDVQGNITLTGTVDGIDIAKNGYITGTGILQGGILTINADTTKFDISDGTGIVTDTTTGVQTIVSWTGLTGQIVTYVGFLTYVALNSAGTVVSSPTPFTRSNSRNYIFIGILFHVFNTTNLDAIQNEHNMLGSVANQIRDLSRSIGKFNVSGNVTSSTGSGLTILKGIGEIFDYGGNWTVNPDDPSVIVNPSVNTSSSGRFSYRMQNGTSSDLLSVIDPNLFDDNTDYPASTYSSNKWGIQRVYLFTTGDVVLSPPQEFFNTKEGAVNSIMTAIHTVIPDLADQLLISYIIVRGGATDLSLSADAEFRQASIFGSNTSGGSAQTLQSTYDNSANPEILTDASRLGLTIQIGSGADTHIALDIKNTAGTSTCTIDGEGSIALSSDLNVNGDLIMAIKTPASAVDTGIIGEIAHDTNFIYVCTATNTWKRIAVATW